MLPKHTFKYGVLCRLPLDFSLGVNIPLHRRPFLMPCPDAIDRAVVAVHNGDYATSDRIFLGS